MILATPVAVCVCAFGSWAAFETTRTCVHVWGGGADRRLADDMADVLLGRTPRRRSRTPAWRAVRGSKPAQRREPPSARRATPARTPAATRPTVRPAPWASTPSAARPPARSALAVGTLQLPAAVRARRATRGRSRAMAPPTAQCVPQASTPRPPPAAASTALLASTPAVARQCARRALRGTMLRAMWVMCIGGGRVFDSVC